MIIVLLSCSLTVIGSLLLVEYSENYSSIELPPYTATIDHLKSYAETKNIGENESPVLAKEVLNSIKNMLASGYIIEDFINNDLKIGYKDIIKWHDQIINNDHIEIYHNGVKIIKSYK